VRNAPERVCDITGIRTLPGGLCPRPRPRPRLTFVYFCDLCNFRPSSPRVWGILDAMMANFATEPHPPARVGDTNDQGLV
jgi:hypothetical protein